MRGFPRLPVEVTNRPPGFGQLLGQPSRPVPTVRRSPNCSAVRALWQSAQRQRMLLSSSDPPWVSGTMWSGTVASRIRPFAAQSRHSGSARSRLRRWATAARPRRRSALTWALGNDDRLTVISGRSSEVSISDIYDWLTTPSNNNPTITAFCGNPPAPGRRDVQANDATFLHHRRATEGRGGVAARRLSPFRGRAFPTPFRRTPRGLPTVIDSIDPDYEMLGIACGDRWLGRTGRGDRSSVDLLQSRAMLHAAPPPLGGVPRAAPDAAPRAALCSALQHPLQQTAAS